MGVSDIPGHMKCKDSLAEGASTPTAKNRNSETIASKDDYHE